MSPSTADAIFIPVTIVVIFAAIGLGIWGYKRAASRNKQHPWFEGTIYASIVLAIGFALLTFRTFLVNLHPDPRDIVAKHYEAIGGIENVADALPIYCKGVVQDSLDKHIGRFQFWYDSGGRFRKEITIGGRLITLVSDGRSRWHTVDTISEPDRTDWPPAFWYPDYIVHDYTHPDTGLSKDDVIYQSKYVVLGSMCYQLRFPDRNGQPYQVVLYEKTSNREKIRQWLPYWTDYSAFYKAIYSDYRDVDGCQYPFRAAIQILPDLSALKSRKLNLIALVITPHADIDTTLFILPETP